MTRLGTAVVGAGMFGAIHARTYAESEKCELLYVCDQDYEAARKLAEQYDATPTTSTCKRSDRVARPPSAGTNCP